MTKPFLFYFFAFLAAEVFGDANISIEEYPYHVSIQQCGEHLCSGAFIHESWIISAASCFNGVKLSIVSVRVATTLPSTGGIDLEVNALIPHPEFDRYTYQNNIALVKLEVPAEYGPKLRPIPLPASKNHQPIEGSISFVTGWWYNLDSARSLLTIISVPVVNLQRCRTVMPPYAPIYEEMICAGRMTNEIETCQGDVGAPLMEGQTLIGVLSYGLGCKTMIHPGIYTRISSYLPWISASSGVSYTNAAMARTKPALEATPKQA